MGTLPGDTKCARLTSRTTTKEVHKCSSCHQPLGWFMGRTMVRSAVSGRRGVIMRGGNILIIFLGGARGNYNFGGGGAGRSDCFAARRPMLAPASDS